jgi:pimeloyl-ACP methyl ester carboxylesterase
MLIPEKPNLICIHGWGANAHTWDRIIPSLQGKVNIFYLSPDQDPNQIPTVVVNAIQTTKTILLAWSLGGVLAAHLHQRYPKQVQHTLLCASSPWWRPLKPLSLRQFYLLQHYGLPEARKLTRQWENLMAQKDGAKPPAVDLHTVNHQDLYCTLTGPLTILLGDHDQITPPHLAQWYAEHLPHASIQILQQCGHTPTLTHPETFIRILLMLAEEGIRQPMRVDQL